MDAIKPKKSLVDETYEALVDSICAGELLPGERLNQDEIALKLNVSRQPVNSALAILRTNGYVEDTGRRGVVVAAIQPDQFQSIYEFRALIEPFAIRLASARIKREHKTQAEKILKKGKAAAKTCDVRALLREDMNFHEMIYRWSGNHVIENSMRVNWPHIRRAMAEVLKNPASAIPTWKEHSTIIQHLLDGDPNTAAKAIKHHIERAGKQTIKVLLDNN